MDQITIAMIGLIQGVSVAVIVGLFRRESNKKNAMYAKQEERARKRERESILSMELLSANVDLGIATATAVRDGKTNGIMETALLSAGEANEKYKNFIRGVAAAEVA